MPTLNAFIQSLISENDKLIQMGIIRPPKDLALVARGDKVENDKGKQRDESYEERAIKRTFMFEEKQEEWQRQGPLLLLWKGLSFRNLLYEKTT